MPVDDGQHLIFLMLTTLNYRVVFNVVADPGKWSFRLEDLLVYEQGNAPCVNCRPVSERRHRQD